jgi:hypothetical protein
MPEAYARHAYITSAATRLARAYACREIATPVVERAEVFQRTLGTDSDVVCSRARHVGSALALLSRGSRFPCCFCQGFVRKEWLLNSARHE